MHLLVKKLNLEIFTHAPRKNSVQVLITLPSGRGKLLMPPYAVFYIERYLLPENWIPVAKFLMNLIKIEFWSIAEC